MGIRQSKKRPPNNPMERGIESRKKMADRERDYENQKLKEEKKAKGKGKKKGDKLKDAQVPIAPERPAVKPTLTLDETKYNLTVKKKLQAQLASDSATFVLNQLMMSVQFFGNYERFVRKFNFVHYQL